MAAKTRAERLAELEAQRKAIEAEEDDEPETEYEIGRGDNYASVSSRSRAGQKLHAFFKDSFGIDLDDEPVQDDKAGDDKDEGKPERKAAGRQQQGGQVRAFRGRGVG